VTIDAVSAANAATSTNTSETSTKTDALGRDTFLSLLVTQLQHQDPLDPQDNSEFLAQLAQFSSLETLQEIKDDMAALRAVFELGLSDAAASDGGV
jgi:flagellar basal-body rod modification protein FlgD